jgi:hypothetical protein
MRQHAAWNAVLDGHGCRLWRRAQQQTIGEPRDASLLVPHRHLVALLAGAERDRSLPRSELLKACDPATSLEGAEAVAADSADSAGQSPRKDHPSARFYGPKRVLVQRKDTSKIDEMQDHDFHVAGIISARCNSYGIARMIPFAVPEAYSLGTAAPNVLPYQALDDLGATYNCYERPCLINMSWVDTVSGSKDLIAAIKKLSEDSRRCRARRRRRPLSLERPDCWRWPITG